MQEQVDMFAELNPAPKLKKRKRGLRKDYEDALDSCPDADRIRAVLCGEKVPYDVELFKPYVTDGRHRHDLLDVDELPKDEKPIGKEQCGLLGEFGQVITYYAKNDVLTMAVLWLTSLGYSLRDIESETGIHYLTVRNYLIKAREQFEAVPEFLGSYLKDDEPE